MKILKISLFFLISAQSVYAEEAYILKLNKSDSRMFDEILVGFLGPKKIVDPEHSSVFYAKRWYESQNQAITISCNTTTVEGEFYSTNCNFEFLPDKASDDVTIEKKSNGVIRASIKDPAAATIMYKNLGMNPFFSNETVEVSGDGAVEEISRVFVECKPLVIMSPEASNCIIEFLPDNVL